MSFGKYSAYGGGGGGGVPPTRQVIAGTGLTGGGALSSDVTLALATPVAIANGGTNNASLSVTSGNIFYGDGSKLVGLAAGTNGQLLTLSSGLPAWVTRSVTTSSPLAGGGSLAADLALSVDSTATLQIAEVDIMRSATAYCKITSPSNTGVQFKDFESASNPGFVFDTNAVKIAGKVMQVKNGGTQLFAVDISQTSIAGTLTCTASGFSLAVPSTAGALLVGQRAAAATTADCSIVSGNTRTAGRLLEVQNNFSDRFHIMFSGKQVWTGATGAKTAGTATLVAGTVTVSTTAVKTGDIIFVTRNTASGTALGVLEANTITDATSFVINAKTLVNAVETNDTSTVNWLILTAA